MSCGGLYISGYHAAVEERQTRVLQEHVSERTCGFESHQPHS